MEDEQRYYWPDELRTKEFNAFVDRLLERGTVDEEHFANLTPVQKDVFSVINRAFGRYRRKCGRLEEDD